MDSIINTIIAGLMLLGVGTLTCSFYKSVKKEAVLQVHRAMRTDMQSFTQKLTRATTNRGNKE